jgi:hypothetical protein
VSATDGLAAAGWLLVLAGGHVLNLWCDREGDATNHKNLVWRDRVPAAWLPRIAALLAGVGLVLASFHPAARWPLMATVALIAAYDLPPAHLAHRWWGGLLAHLAGYAVAAPWFGQCLAGDPEPGRLAGAAVWLAAPVAAAYLWTTLPDRSGDAAVGKVTWAVRWGVRATTATAFAAAAGGAALGALRYGIAGGAAGAGLAATALVLHRHPAAVGLVRAGVALAVAAAAVPALQRWPAATLVAAACGGFVWWSVERTAARARRPSRVGTGISGHDRAGVARPHTSGRRRAPLLP